MIHSDDLMVKSCIKKRYWLKTNLFFPNGNFPGKTGFLKKLDQNSQTEYLNGNVLHLVTGLPDQFQAFQVNSGKWNTTYFIGNGIAVRVFKFPFYLANV